MNATFIAGTMPRVSGIIMRRGSDISPYKGMGKEGKVKERREREREKREKGTTKENKFAGTGETTRARRESVEKRFLAV